MPRRKARAFRQHFDGQIAMQPARHPRRELSQAFGGTGLVLGRWDLLPGASGSQIDDSARAQRKGRLRAVIFLD